MISNRLTLSLIVLLSLCILFTFLGCGLIKEKVPPPVVFDYPDIEQRDTLRVITRNHPLTYYLYRGTRRGFDYELIQKFADEHDLVLQVVIPPTFEDMIPWLRAGKGDVVASMMTITPERSEYALFTDPYHSVKQVAVGTEADPPPDSLMLLNGETILIRKGSSYDERLKQLVTDKYDITIEYMDELEDTREPIEVVAKGETALTVVDNSIAQLEQHFFPGLLIGVAVSEEEPIAWAVRPNAPILLDELNEFLQRHDRSAFFNILKRRYFDTPKRFLRHRTAQLALRSKGKISKYDHHFRDACDDLDLDWRLLAAQAYHESGFQPELVSWAGAVGVMQLMPRTAESLGVVDIYDPKENIHGGADYLSTLFDLYDETDSSAQSLLALVAYNMGLGHVADARRLTVARGANPNAWEDVRSDLIRLEDPEIYRDLTYGYARGRSAISYAESVLERYTIFTQLVPDSVIEAEDKLAQN